MVTNAHLSAFYTIYAELLHPTYGQRTFLSTSVKCAIDGFVKASRYFVTISLDYST